MDYVYCTTTRERKREGHYGERVYTLIFIAYDELYIFSLLEGFIE